MKRTLIHAAALVGFASAANAATLMIDPGGVGGEYNVGDLITITVTGDSEGASDSTIFGQIVFSNPAIAAPNIYPARPAQNTLLAPGPVTWGQGGTNCTASSCVMFNAFSGSLPPTPMTVTNLLVSTVSFVATTPGTRALTWSTTGGTQLDFFGLTSAPGSSITVVPEPTTITLLGVGLFGLAVASRRRA